MPPIHIDWGLVLEKVVTPVLIIGVGALLGRFSKKNSDKLDETGKKVDETQEKVTQISVNVDGRMTEAQNEIKVLKEHERESVAELRALRSLVERLTPLPQAMPAGLSLQPTAPLPIKIEGKLEVPEMALATPISPGEAVPIKIEGKLEITADK